jgi:HTH-type transcriptional repressor of NAD biosynthesis genes
MTTSYILMAAIPPTLGHVDLINFAKNLTGDAHVILVTRAEEPYQDERREALTEHFQHVTGVRFSSLHQDSLLAEGNAYWAEVLKAHGFVAGDILVASEEWGAEIAAMLDGEFYPYDIKREIRYTKAGQIRDDIEANWAWIIPEFQRRLQRRVVIFGAESIGKSTLTQALKNSYKDAVSVFEYARPYLEVTEGELDVPKMLGIWRGQKALQATVAEMTPTPRVVFLDTDLYSTLGYWQFWQPETIPAGLAEDAELLKANLYILLNSNIPFEEDPIRYGGDKREQTDDYWRGVLEANNLPYVEVKVEGVSARLTEAREAVDALLPTTVDHKRLDS